jgi:serine/threonine protein kinase
VCRSYGAVYKAVNKFTNEECAIKILPAEDDPSKLEFEIDFLRRMSSPYIVSFLEGYNFEGELWVSLLEI